MNKPKPTNRLLGEIYQVDEKQIRRWRNAGANLSDAEETLLFLQVQRTRPKHLEGVSIDQQRAMQARLDALAWPGPVIVDGEPWTWMDDLRAINFYLSQSAKSLVCLRFNKSVPPEVDKIVKAYNAAHNAADDLLFDGLEAAGIDVENEIIGVEPPWKV